MPTRTEIRSFPARCAFGLRLRLLAAMAPEQSDRERGDVPGWVMITLMSAVLVAAILALAQRELVALFEAAIAQVRQ